MINLNYLTDHILYQILNKTFENSGFHWPFCSCMRKKHRILSLYGKIRVSGNSNSRIYSYSEYFIKKQKVVTDNHPIRINVNRTKNRIKFKIKVRYYSKLLMYERMKLLGRTRRKDNWRWKWWKCASFLIY